MELLKSCDSFSSETSDDDDNDEKHHNENTFEVLDCSDDCNQPPNKKQYILIRTKN